MIQRKTIIPIRVYHRSPPGASPKGLYFRVISARNDYTRYYIFIQVPPTAAVYIFITFFIFINKTPRRAAAGCRWLAQTVV